MAGDVNARLQAHAIGSGGPVNDLTAKEGAGRRNEPAKWLDRILNLWKMPVASSMNQ
jgi:hypothetical protein